MRDPGAIARIRASDPVAIIFGRNSGLGAEFG